MIRITLTLEDFQDLVAGEVVEIILADIGFAAMRKAIAEAEARQ